VRIALVTCRILPEPDPDAALLDAALRARGHAGVPVAWDDPAASLDGFDLFLLRSTWNYHLQPEAFLAWIDRAAAAAPVLNPPDVVRWNAHKGYLEELERRGVPVVPTRILRHAQDPDVAGVLDRTGWDDVVVKPCVSAASWRTRRFQGASLAGAVAFAEDLLAERDVLLQRYEPGALDPGERCLVWIAGRFTHAIRKRPRLDGDHESVSADAPPTAAEIELGNRVLEPLVGRLTYARVDVFPAADGAPLLSEVELIEPSLFFRHGPHALERLVRALEARGGRAA
jgi:hypothetical protein